MNNPNSKTKAKAPLMIGALLTAALALSACATVKGAGNDLESASDAVKDEIDK
jgi:predicted small secreted protein